MLEITDIDYLVQIIMYKDKRILLVDNDIDVTTTFRMALESCDFVVDIYNDPILALSEFEPRFYDFITYLYQDAKNERF